MVFCRKEVSNQTLVMITFLVFLALAQFGSTFNIESCGTPLGMESGAILDSQITASSAHDLGNVGPQHARLRVDNNGGAWCPKHMVSRGLSEYLQIDLLQVHVITSVRTQGRFGRGQGQEYSEAYVLEYWRPGFTKWQRWKNIQGKEILSGNINTYSEVENILQPVIFASKVRIYPYSQYERTVCLRADLVGCPWKEGIVSYSIPKSIQRSTEIDLSDKSFDGHDEGDRYVDGLGQLVDGQKGTDNFRTDSNGFGKGYEWVGWRNDTQTLSGKPVELVFEFDAVRNFSSVILHTNNLYSKDVQVFVHAKVMFSNGGLRYVGEPVEFSYMPDTILDNARDVTIKLHNRIGRFLKIQLYFAQRWIMLSEVSFVSVPAKGNFTVEEINENSLPEDTLQNSPENGKIKTNLNKGQRTPQIISPKPIDHKPKSNFIVVIIGVLSTVIILLVAVIMYIVVKNKRSRNSRVLQHQFQQNFNYEANPVDSRFNSNKVFMDDNDSIDKRTLYHEPFNVNMYTSAPSGWSFKDLERHHASPDYAEVLHIAQEDYATPCQLQFPNETSSVPIAQSLSFQNQPPIPPVRFYRDISTTGKHSANNWFS